VVNQFQKKAFWTWHAGKNEKVKTDKQIPSGNEGKGGGGQTKGTV